MCCASVVLSFEFFTWEQYRKRAKSRPSGLSRIFHLFFLWRYFHSGWNGAMRIYVLLALAVGCSSSAAHAAATLNDKRFRISGSINSITTGGDSVLA